MRFLTRADNYALFEVERRDDEIPGALGKPYYAGTVLLFPLDATPEIGNEIAWSASEEEAEQLASLLPRHLVLELFGFKIKRAKAAADAAENSRKADGKSGKDAAGGRLGNNARKGGK